MSDDSGKSEHSEAQRMKLNTDEVLIGEIKIGDFAIVTYFEEYYPAQITDKNSEKMLANAMVKAGASQIKGLEQTNNNEIHERIECDHQETGYQIMNDDYLTESFDTSSDDDDENCADNDCVIKTSDREATLYKILIPDKDLLLVLNNAIGNVDEGTETLKECTENMYIGKGAGDSITEHGIVNGGHVYENNYAETNLGFNEVVIERTDKAEYIDNFDGNKKTFFDGNKKRRETSKKGFNNDGYLKTDKERLQEELVGLIRKSQQDAHQLPLTETSNTEIDDIIWQDFDNLVKSSNTVTSPTAVAIAELKMFSEEANLEKKKQNPLLWWKEREKIYPWLAVLAKRYLPVIATSVPC
ncbi:unnamed protein product [Diabrotica balteata]|uniref:HAT C-terminal dimerisation domain-containing protein n=1 Tax=Diabrotica balteata TaxID=107213 RepID=A0A9N9XIG7_DIABA|nr:unnamed protein product [Diabrotica balteata]